MLIETVEQIQAREEIENMPNSELIFEYAEYCDCCIEDLLSDFEEHYQGAYDSLEDYAHDWLENTSGLVGVPKHLENYIDFESYGRDMELGGEIFTIHRGYKSLHVFLSN